MSDTPRTDKHEDGRIGSPLDLSEYERVLQFARTLERENTELITFARQVAQTTYDEGFKERIDAELLLAKLGER